jgi:hypothetical protein
MVQEPIKSDQAARAARKARLTAIDAFYGPILDDVTAQEQAARAAVTARFWARVATVWDVLGPDDTGSLLDVTAGGRLTGEYAGWAAGWVLSALSEAAGALARIEAAGRSESVRAAWDRERFAFAFGGAEDAS